MRRALIWLSSVALGVSARVAAQSPIVTGVVMDTAGRPLQAAEVVALRRGPTVLSDKQGRFLVGGLSPGMELFRVRSVGYAPQFFELTLKRGDTIRVAVSLLRDSIQTLPELRSDAPASPTRRELFQNELRERGLRNGAPPSSFISRKELEDTPATRLLNLLADHGMKIRTDGRTGKQFVSCPRGGGRPAIYLDGTLVDGGPTGPSSLFRAGAMSPVFDLENFPPGQAEAVEVYKSPAERPVEYNSSGALCVVLLWTRRGP